MHKKLVAFFFIVKDSKGVIDVSEYIKFAFAIANKNVRKCWAERRTITVSSNCQYITLLKLNSIIDAAICISSINTKCENGDGLRSLS